MGGLWWIWSCHKIDNSFFCRPDGTWPYLARLMSFNSVIIPDAARSHSMITPTLLLQLKGSWQCLTLKYRRPRLISNRIVFSVRACCSLFGFKKKKKKIIWDTPLKLCFEHLLLFIWWYMKRRFVNRPDSGGSSFRLSNHIQAMLEKFGLKIKNFIRFEFSN